PGVHDQLDWPRGLEALRDALGRQAGRSQQKQHAPHDHRLPPRAYDSSARRRHALNLPNSGISRISSANDSITAEIGLDTRIDRLPCDIMSDWRSARSMPPPSARPRISGAAG